MSESVAIMRVVGYIHCNSLRSSKSWHETNACG